MTSPKKVAVIYHIFYEDSMNHIKEELENLNHFQTSWFFNICSDTPNQLETKEALLKHFPDAVITISSNKGKDIGGKLLLLRVCIETGTEPDWIIFLHDKKSLQALNARTWKNDLLQIVNKENIQKIDTIISNNKECGIIASRNYIRKEIMQSETFTGNNGIILSKLVKEYNIRCRNYEYVAGTMFWAKGPALLNFFKKFDPLKIRQSLEEGNVIDNFAGTMTHSRERLLSWIITSQGLNIKTI
jgi:lipopolysaccharide biosynthesis protein